MGAHGLPVCSIREASSAIARRTLSPVELLDACLDRIERYEGVLRSFVALRDEEARAEARKLEAELRVSGSRGPLHGIPVAVKDLFDVVGLVTTANSRVYCDNVAASDAALVRRLRMAGAVVVGKLQTYELAIAPPSSGDLYPPTRNPWNIMRSPGGSSSGAAVAIAADLCLGAFGTDTGGSVRHPAAFNGIVGLKPTRDLVSRRGVIPLAPSVDHIGPLARSIGDVATLLDAAVRSAPSEPMLYSAAIGGLIRGLRVGVPYSYLHTLTGMQHEVLEAYEEALSVFRACGAVLRPVTLPPLDQIRRCYDTIVPFEAAVMYRSRLRTAPTRFGAVALEKILGGCRIRFDEYWAAQRFRAALRWRLDSLMHEVDVIATPTVRETAPPLQTLLATGRAARQPFTALYNLTGQPSVSIPCGFDRRGLPIGLLLSGRLFADAPLLRVAAAYQRETGWHECRPSLDNSF